jgi:phage major head subunit gpT-like protein
LAVAADLSEASLEQSAIDISEFDDDRGIPIACQIRKMVVPTQLQFVATRILQSPYRSGTGDNDINAVYTLGTVAEGFCVNHRLTDPDAWFLLTDCPDGLKHFVRKNVQRGIEGDFETGNLRYKARERYSYGWSDWRGAYGSPGGGS